MLLTAVVVVQHLALDPIKPGDLSQAVAKASALVCRGFTGTISTILEPDVSLTYAVYTKFPLHRAQLDSKTACDRLGKPVSGEPEARQEGLGPEHQARRRPCCSTCTGMIYQCSDAGICQSKTYSVTIILVTTVPSGIICSLLVARVVLAIGLPFVEVIDVGHYMHIGQYKTF